MAHLRLSPVRLELTAFGSGGQRSIQLSYGDEHLLLFITPKRRISQEYNWLYPVFAAVLGILYLQFLRILCYDTVLERVVI
jgi:hypothetical protein